MEATPTAKPESPPPLPLFRRLLLGLLSLALATAVWLPTVHFLFASDPPSSADLSARHLRMWTDPALRKQEVERMRATNAEWDFMGRSFLIWGLANHAMRRTDEKAACLQAMDAIIDETLRIEREEGIYFFLMGYAKVGTWVEQPPRSIFLDGEIGLMLGLRRMVEEKPEYKTMLAERVKAMVERMSRSPAMSGESYPNECWTFCNSVALAAIRIHDHLDGADHSAFFHEWVACAKIKLLEPTTGILVSSYRVDGQIIDGPEGSTIWLVAHMLQIVDEEFARDQYERARRELGVTILGFAYAKEWPASCRGPSDVDSGPIIPVLEVSAGSSGLAFVGAASFGDATYLRTLTTTLNFAGFPRRDEDGLRFCASNQVGDAVMFYAMTLGPAWERVMAGGKK